MRCVNAFSLGGVNFLLVKDVAGLSFVKCKFINHSIILQSFSDNVGGGSLSYSPCYSPSQLLQVLYEYSANVG